MTEHVKKKKVNLLSILANTLAIGAILMLIFFIFLTLNEEEEVFDKEDLDVSFIGIRSNKYAIYEIPSKKEYYRVSVSNWESNNPNELKPTEGTSSIGQKKVKGYPVKSRVILIHGEWRIIEKTSVSSSFIDRQSKDD